MRFDLHIHFGNFSRLEECARSHGCGGWEMVIQERSLQLYILANSLSYRVPLSCSHIVFKTWRNVDYLVRVLPQHEKSGV